MKALKQYAVLMALDLMLVQKGINGLEGTWSLSHMQGMLVMRDLAGSNRVLEAFPRWPEGEWPQRLLMPLSERGLACISVQFSALAVVFWSKWRHSYMLALLKDSYYFSS